MIRILIFTVWVIFFAFALTAIFLLDGSVPIEAFGWRMDAPAALVVIAGLIFTAVLIIATSTIKDLAGAPKAARARREIALREKGLSAVTRGLEAIAAGDGAAARREAQVAAKALPAAPVAKLIAAQAAQLTGDDVAAGAALADMLDTPETEYLALRGLYARAMRAGETDAARGYAERAFERRDSARWAFDAVFDLALGRRDYAAATTALTRAAKSGAIEKDAADRGHAATSTAAAFASNAAGDQMSGLADALSALRRNAGFAPAAVLAARLTAADGNRRKAEKILGAAFAIAPTRALVEELETLDAGDDANAQAEALVRFSAKNPDSREADLAMARAHLLRGEASAAAGVLAKALRSAPTARALLLMGEAQAMLHGEAAARPWLLRAASAPRNSDPSAEAFFRITGDGWSRLVRDYMDYGRLAPPSLEAPAPGLTEEELALTALPAPTPTTAPDPADAPGDLALEPPPVDRNDAEDAASEDDAPDETADDEADGTDTDENDQSAEEALERATAAARGVS